MLVTINLTMSTCTGHFKTHTHTRNNIYSIKLTLYYDEFETVVAQLLDSRLSRDHYTSSRPTFCTVDAY